MLRFIVSRLIGMIVVLWVVSVVTFAIFYLAPTVSHTSPVYYFVGKVIYQPGSPQFKLLEHRYGFDLPIYEQYWHWLRQIFIGGQFGQGMGTVVQCHAPCLGYSFRLNDTVSHLIWQALPVSVSLCVGASVLWLVGGVVVGTISALKPGSFVDRAGMVGALVAISLPVFFTGPLLLLLFEYKLHWLSNLNYTPITQNPLQWLEVMLLPWLTLAFAYAAMYARMTRSNMSETLGDDYMRTARAKGLPRRTVIVKHGLRAALTPVVTIFAMDLALLFGTTVITEQVFNFRGLGWLAIHAIGQQDLPVIMGVTVVAAVVIVVANAIVDILYAFIDPRVRL